MTLLFRDDVQAICWNQTSVNFNPWRTRDPDISWVDDEGYRPYNINKDDRHWFLFDELEKINAQT